MNRYSFCISNSGCDIGMARNGAGEFVRYDDILPLLAATQALFFLCEYELGIDKPELTCVRNALYDLDLLPDPPDEDSPDDAKNP